MTKKFTKKDLRENGTFAIFSYIFAPLVFFSKRKKESKFLEFHANQGMNLFIVEFIYIILLTYLLYKIKFDKVCVNDFYGVKVLCGYETPIVLKVVLITFSFLLLVCNIWGIINVLYKEETYIPVIGKINLFK